MPGVTLELKPGSPRHKKIANELRDRVKAAKDALEKTRHDKWRDAESRSLAYLPERAVDANRRTQEREKGKPTYTTIQIPYSYAILMASHTYWTTVFLSRTPVLQYAGRHGEAEMKIQAVEALTNYQLEVGEMLVPLYLWLHDVGKYGVGILGGYWAEETAHISEIQNVEEKILGMIPTGKVKKRKVSREIPGYMGNKVFNVRPLDFLPDPRVSFKHFQGGEFCGRYVEISWNTLFERREVGLFTNIDKVEGNVSTAFDKEPGSSAMEMPDTSTFFRKGTDGKNMNVVKAYEMHVRLIPKHWDLGRGELPELWVFTVTTDFQVILEAQPLGANHNRFPYFLIELEPEAYSVSSRGLHEILAPINDTMDWLVNTHFYNVRKTLNNQYVVDPSKVVIKDLLSPLPGGIIRMKAAAYGTDIRSFLQQLDVADVTKSHINDLKVMNEMGQRIIGVNDQLLGMLTTGGRQTATEVRTASGFGINRLKTQSEFFSAMGWSPLAQFILQNSQQYYDAERAFRIVGSLASAAPNFITATPEAISGFYDFIPIDGTLPVDRFAQANLWRTLLGEMQKSPQLLAEFDLGKIFLWVAQLAGLKNVSQFKKVNVNTQPDGTLEEEARKGNVVPINEISDLTRVPEPGQVSQVGPTV